MKRRVLNVVEKKRPWKIYLQELQRLSVGISVICVNKTCDQQISKGTGQALYRERRKTYPDNPKA